jgi:hypothetical protein
LSGVKHGYGVYEYASGSRYEGNWVNNSLEGKGTMNYSNNDVYVGDVIFFNYFNQISGLEAVVKAEENIFTLMEAGTKENGRRM